MSDYLVSARKYRPQRFEDVVGQNHITTTLDNAILNNKIAHAYLFCGPRGVGKTTCARIFAKYVNKNTDSQYNIFELDAASNNGVDHIRNLIEQVKIPPQVGRYKIYIIDEVHMLSDAAFNAFLKTLEEPPKHSIFILATTEKNKLIPTILSRCQIFDFKKISITEITKYLLQICQEEDIKVEKHTLQLIAEKGDGSLRDSLSIFDRIHAYCNKNWDHTKVLQILSSLDIHFSISLTNCIIEQNIPNAILKINNILEKGFEPKEIIKALITHFRNLMMLKSPETSKLINIDQDITENLTKQSEFFKIENILTALENLNETNKNYNESINKRFLVELCVMQLCSHNLIKKKNLILKPEKSTQEEKTEKSTQEEKTEKGTQEEKTEKSTQEEKTEKSTQEEKPEKGTQEEKSNLISISEELQKKEKFSITNNTHPSESSWTEKAMLNIWDKFSQQLKKEKKINAHNIFTRYTPKKKNKNLITLELVSLSEKAEIEDAKKELLELIKYELNNDLISMEINVSTRPEKEILYKKEDKLKYLLEKNKNIQILKNKLNLNLI